MKIKLFDIENDRGFTLIELLVVISIIGLLSSVVLAATSSARDKGQVAAGNTFDRHTYGAFGANAIIAYNFDEGPPNTVVKDLSGNGNDATIYGTGGAWVTGINGKGKAYDFKGVSKACIGLSAPPGWATVKTLSLEKPYSTSNGSISVWVLPASSSGGYEPIASIDESSRMILNLNGQIDTSKFISVYANRANATFISGTNSIAAAIGKWNHVLFSWSGNNARLYINGKLNAENNNFPTDAFIGLTYFRDLCVGGEFSMTNRKANVQIDNFRFYSQSLQTAQVEQLYALEAPKFNVAVNK